MAIVDARNTFRRMVADAENLIEIHKDLGRVGTGASAAPRRGRRYRERALNHGVVVITVAAWQAYVENFTSECLECLRPPPGDSSEPSYRVIRSLAMNVGKNFSTPNAENTRDLLMIVGVDPWASWAWREGNRDLTSADIRSRMNEWLKVRHAIAHGDDLPAVSVLANTPSGHSLWRAKAESCVRFFGRVVDASEQGASSVYP